MKKKVAGYIKYIVIMSAVQLAIYLSKVFFSIDDAKNDVFIALYKIADFVLVRIVNFPIGIFFPQFFKAENADLISFLLLSPINFIIQFFLFKSIRNFFRRTEMAQDG